MKLGINTFLFASPFTTERLGLLREFKEMGFDGVEIAFEKEGDLDYGVTLTSPRGQRPEVLLPVRRIRKRAGSERHTGGAGHRQGVHQDGDPGLQGPGMRCPCRPRVLHRGPGAHGDPGGAEAAVGHGGGESQGDVPLRGRSTACTSRWKS